MEKIRVGGSNAAAQPHYLYDLSLELPERFQKRMFFPSAIAAAVFLGVSPQRIYVSRNHKHRIWSEAQGKWFAVRLATVKLSEI
jgi:hypothetical protein